MSINKIFHKSSKKNKMSKKFQFIFLIFYIFMIFGCATPRITVNSDTKVEDYNNYKVIYIFAPDSKKEDPRNIFPKVVDRLEGLGFQVNAINQKNPMIGAQGTGFIVDPKGYVLTCAHIFEKEKNASIWIKGKRYKADVINTDKEKDLALLKINENQKLDLQSLPISKDTIYKMGQEVYTIGFPLSDILGNSPRLNKGLISSTVGLKDDPDHLQISVEIQPGNSGSPLVNEDGLVVGMIQSTLSPMNVLARTGGNLPQNVNFATKTNIIKEFIKKINGDITIEID